MSCCWSLSTALEDRSCCDAAPLITDCSATCWSDCVPPHAVIAHTSPNGPVDPCRPFSCEKFWFTAVSTTHASVAVNDTTNDSIPLLILMVSLDWKYVGRVEFDVPLNTGHFGDDLPSQSLDWCKTPKTEHNYNQQHKNLNYIKLQPYADTEPNKTKAWFTGLLSGPYCTTVHITFPRPKITPQIVMILPSVAVHICIAYIPGTSIESSKSMHSNDTWLHVVGHSLAVICVAAVDHIVVI